jgi:hypothetical protein
VRRSSLIASQSIASMPEDEVVAAIRPNVQRYVAADIG